MLITMIKAPKNAVKIGTERMVCPVCGNIHDVEKYCGHATMMIHSRKVSYEQEFLHCSETSSTMKDFVTHEIKTHNLANARKAYRQIREGMGNEEQKTNLSPNAITTRR